MIPNNPIIVYSALGIVFIAILIVLLSINHAVKTAQRRRKIIQAIRNGRDAWGNVMPSSDEEKTSVTGNLTKLFTGIGSRFSNKSSAAYTGLRLRLLQAGIRSQNAAQVFWGAKIWSPVILLLSFIGIRLAVPQVKLMSAPAVLSTLIAVGLLGFYLPEVWLNLKAGLRKTKIMQDLPDALDLLVVCVEAGLGLDSAFKRVADEMIITSPQLSDEFKLLNLELRAGKPRQDALRNLSARTDIDSLKSLVTLMIQTEMFGTGITKALRVFSDSFRTKRFQKAEEIAAKLPVKMLIPMVFFIFPTFMAVMVGPAAISIWDNWLSK
jgi:tight adherence protein C